MRLLAVFAHPDDELGCVGTLKKHAERGDDVMLVWTTQGELASQFLDQSEADVRATRLEHGRWVAERLGARHHFFDMGDSRMTGDRKEALELARLYAHFRPDAVLAWSDDHPHPDHRMSAKIAFDAVTLARIPKIMGEGPGEALEPHRKPVRFYQYLGNTGSPTIHIDISEQIDTVLEVFAFYRDFYGWSITPEQFRAGRAQRGRESGVGYAESFQLKRGPLPALAFLP